jgi:predicted XRE-type DNA-binding protein
MSRSWDGMIHRSDDGCWLWTGQKNSKGYGVYKSKFLVHRLSFRVHNDYGITIEDMDGMVVMHSCDNPLCCNPAHLSLGTQQDNMEDMTEKGRRKCIEGGERHPCSKLTEQQVIEIRNRYANGGIKQRQLATEYDVKQSTISEIVNGKKWKI